MSGYGSDSSGRVIRELSRDLGLGQSRRALSATSATNSALRFEPSFDEVLNSTRPNLDDDSPFLPKMRPTAQKMGQWNPSQPEDHITASAVNREFRDFDQNTSHSSEEASLSIEFGRALSKGSRGTPSRVDRSGASEVLINEGHNSLYDVAYSPQIQSKSSRQPGNATPSSLRKGVQIRRPASYAQNNELNRHEKLPPPKADQRRSAYVAAHYTRESVENDTFQQARTHIQNRHAPAPSNNIRNARFSSRSKPTAAVDRASAYSDNHFLPTPQRTTQTPPRSAPQAFGASFALPDLPNLTELVDGKYQDGTPIFSRNTKSRSQMAASSSRNSQPPSLPYAPVDGLELPKDEKELIASLHLLQDKLAQMERERADSDQKTYEYEQEIIQLRSEMEQQRNIRRSDSALGSSDGEGNGKVTARTKLQIEKTRLEASVQTLQQQLDSAERKFTVAETNAKRVTKERDSLVTQLGVAFYSSEELKNDVNFLEKENQTLRESIDDRDAIIRDLRIQLNHTQELHQEATQTLTKKEAEINLQTANDASIVAENATLRQKLANLAAKEEENRRRVRQEAETARITARAEQEAMKAENDQLLAELKLSKAKREAEMKRWAVKEVQLKATIDCRDGTVQNPNGISQQNNSNAVHRSKSKHSNAGQANNAVDLNMDGKRRVSTGTSLGQEAKILRSESKSSRQSRRVSAPPSSKSVEQPSNEYSTMLEFSSLSYDRVRGEVEKEHVSRTNGQAVSAAPKAILGDDTMAAIRRNVEKEHFARVNGRPTSPDSVLSAFSPGRIRRQIQAEYLAANPLRPASLDSVLDDASVSLHQSTGKDLTTHSIASSTGSRRSAHARASSADGSLAREKPDQDFTGRSRASSTGQTSQDADIHSIGSKQDTQQSIRSLTGTRPRARGVPTEMTSAFIIPDITLNIPNVLNTTLSTSAHAVLDKLAPHDSQNCAVCYRIASKLDSKLENFAIPVPIPVSTLNEQEGDADVTFRPADAPHKALSRVIKELADEIVHLKHSLHKTERRLNIHDPARGSRDRRALHSAIDSLNRSIAAKSSQLYDLYDVLESHKDELTTHAGPAAAREIEEDFSNMTEDVEKILAELAAERHATIQSPPRPAVAQDQIDSESELPWNGISPTDTESFSKMFDLHL